MLEIKHLLYEKRFTIEGARKWLENRGKPEPAKAKPPSGTRRVQGELFTGGAVLDEIRKELTAILAILK